MIGVWGNDRLIHIERILEKWTGARAASLIRNFASSNSGKQSSESKSGDGEKKGDLKRGLEESPSGSGD